MGWWEFHTEKTENSNFALKSEHGISALCDSNKLDFTVFGSIVVHSFLILPRPAGAGALIWLHSLICVGLISEIPLSASGLYRYLKKMVLRFVCVRSVCPCAPVCPVRVCPGSRSGVGVFSSFLFTRALRCLFYSPSSVFSTRVKKTPEGAGSEYKRHRREPGHT